MRKQFRTIGACLILALALGSLTGCSKKTSGEPDVTLAETTPAATTEAVQETKPAETEPVTEAETTVPATTVVEDDKQVVVNGVTLMNVKKVSAEDVDENGYAVYSCEMSGTYHFSMSNSENTKWKVYVLDQKFDGSLDELSKKNVPALEGDGKITVKKGQYIYIYCSANDATQETPDEGTVYQFGIEVITK